MSIPAASKPAFNIQADRALYYARWLLLGFGLSILAAPFTVQAVPWIWFATWALLCGVAARRGHMLAWATLCLTPLALICLMWLADLPSDDLFGIRWAYIFSFVGACMVTAATGILALLPRDEVPKAKGQKFKGSNPV